MLFDFFLPAFSVFLMTLIFNAKPMQGHSRGRRCRLPPSSEQPYSINTCLNCGRFDSLPRIISTCHLVELREEINTTGELIQSIGETLVSNLMKHTYQYACLDEEARFWAQENRFKPSIISLCVSDVTLRKHAHAIHRNFYRCKKYKISAEKM